MHLDTTALRAFEGQWPQLGDRVLIDPTSAVIGDVVLGDDVSVWPQATLRGDVNSIQLGARSNVQDGAILHVTHRGGPAGAAGYALSIGEEVTVGHRAMLHGCHIGDRVLVGMSATIMDGAVVEADVMIAAGALIPPGKRLASGWLYKGTAQQARRLTTAEIDGLRYNALHYVRLKDRYLAARDAEQRPATGRPLR